MAEVTVNLTGYLGLTGFIAWPDDVSLGSIFAANGMDQILSQIGVFDNGTFSVSISGFNNRFTPAFEATGRIIVTASDGETLEVTIGNADMSEVYTWTPTNSAEVTAFNTHVRGLTDHLATLTLTDEPAAAEVVLSAQGVSLALSVGQPTLVVGDVPDPADTSVTVDLTGFQSSPGFAITWDDDQVLGGGLCSQWFITNS